MKKHLFTVLMSALALPVIQGCAGANARNAPEKLRVEVFERENANSSPAENNYYTDWIKERCLKELNLDIEFVPVSRWSEGGELRALTEAGSAPDVCATYDLRLVNELHKAGKLSDLKQALEREGEDLTAFLGADLSKRFSDEKTGEVYALPARRVYQARSGAFIRKDWLDALGLAVPYTTEEFYDVMVAFRDKIPQKDGKITPLVMNKNVAWRAAPLLESFIDAGLTEEDRYALLAAESSVLMPGYKEGVRFLNKMYNDKLINEDFGDENFSGVGDDLAKNGLVGAYMGEWDAVYRVTPGIQTELAKNVGGGVFFPMNPFQNANGVTFKSVYGKSGVFIICPTKNAENAVKYLNWLSVAENRRYLQLGDKGVTWDDVDGVPQMKNIEGERAMNSQYNIDYTLIINGLDMGSEELNMRALAAGYPVREDLVRRAYEHSMFGGYAYPEINQEIEAETMFGEELNAIAQQLLIDAVRAAPGRFDEIWGEGIRRFLAAGGEEVVEERREAYRKDVLDAR
ncbi:MAG: extracellular solute-binding protein [Clostridiales bacterium]|jgi:putative aldouronate transport system substrate-binding protein|nr:extracellular solute-binding protein [Clostridiales bacterium]